MLTRRRLLVASAATAAAFSLPLQGADPVPAALDHILLGCRDLNDGIAFIDSHTGIRGAFGGVHPGRGTQNALLSLGDRHYLEIIAPDPNQRGESVSPFLTRPGGLVAHLEALNSPQLVGWAAHTDDLAALATRLRAAGVAFTGPTAGSRKRPDGQLLQWQTLNLADDQSGLLPFFIQWSADSPHPAVTSPQGCNLIRFELVSPHADDLARILAKMALELAMVNGSKPKLHALINGPKGELSLTS